MKTANRLFPLLPGFLLLMSCTLPTQTVTPNSSNPMKTVAVLPMYNATNDVEGPRMVRELTAGRIPRWHYTSRPLNEVDQILKDQMGLTLGSQLELTTPQKLGAALGVDGVLYGYLLDFDDVTTGVYNEKRVRAGFRLVDTKTGNVVWAGGRGVRNSSGTLGSAAAARDDGIGGLKSVPGVTEIPRLAEWEQGGSASSSSLSMAFAEKLLDKATGGYLKAETETMLDRIFANLPPGGGTGEATQAALPKVPAVPAMAAPPPSAGNPFFSYLKFGERDFTSDLVMTSVLKRDNREMVFHGKLAKGGANFRTDIDMNEAMKNEAKGAPPGLFKTASISRGHGTKSYTLYPDLKKYMEIPVAEKDNKEPKIVKKKVGEDVIDGRKCDKYQVEVTPSGGTTFQGLIWEPKEMKGFIVKSEFDDGNAKQTMELRNVKLVTPPAPLFEVPKDYTVAASFIDLMSEQK